MKALLLLVALTTTVLVQAQQQTTDAPAPAIFHYVEQMPQPPYDIVKYLSDNAHYPESAMKNNIEGRVVIQFVVNEDGCISDCSVVKSVGHDCDEEALRVIRSMPAWKPGRQNGKEVKVYYNQPVSFKLKDPEQVKISESGYDVSHYLNEHIHYPDSAIAHKIHGYVYVQFVINENGSISDTKVTNSLSADCDAEALTAVSNMPAWKSGKQSGTAMISFRLDSTIDGQPTKATIFSYVEQLPAAGYSVLDYIAQNVRYPDTAMQANIEGRVLVKFVINEDGSISAAKVIKGIGGGCDEEALRVIRNMPGWKPGTQNGKPVKVYFTQSINFQLTDDKQEKIRKNEILHYNSINMRHNSINVPR